ncbi:hypothetical protein [Actinomadura sp. WMMA1423]|uniref:hypothetical protein n=1 Tax=Actinomadura sp. WMMA1423 TaxID=2591108 RepID=UPI001147A494|nr:hypothetical protein [Actinomadura sp. WMMA1423]
MTVGLIEIDAGDAPAFTVAVDPADGTTAMSATITSAVGTPTSFAMTTGDDGATWTGIGPTLTTPGEYTAVFTTTGTGAGVQHYTVIVAAPPPLTSDLRRVRLLIADTDPTARTFRVDELADFLAMEGGSVKLAAASALGVIATSEALISKVIRTKDLTTDGAKLAAELRARAAELRRQANEEDPEIGGFFDVVDFVDPFSRVLGPEGTELESF